MKQQGEPRSQLVLAFDFGTRKIGVAVGQRRIGSATPLPPIRANNGIPDAQALERTITEWQPDLLLVGMPYNMDGSENQMCLRARKFGRRLEARFSIPWQEMDERLTSFEARSSSADNPAASVDSRSAAVLIESWFRERPEAAG